MNMAISAIHQWVLDTINVIRQYRWDAELGDYVKLETPFDGIHAVYSGFNTKLREKFGVDPREVTDEMVALGLLRKWMVKGGVMLFPVTEQKPTVTNKKAPVRLRKLDALLNG